MDDDEVAVQHGPSELDYLQLTEAMVNVRATVYSARQLGVIGSEVAAGLVGIAKALFYKERTYEKILRIASEGPLSSAELERFALWLPSGQIDQKRLDALALARAMVDHHKLGIAPLQVTYRMAHTFAWEFARQRHHRSA